MQDAVERAFTARLDCHYLLRSPSVVDEHTPLVLTLHGFGGNPEVMLRLTARLFSTQPIVAAVQGPYQFLRDATTRDVGYGWITSRHPADSIRLHRYMVSYVLNAVGREFGIPPRRRILAGFSQSVALNYRFAATCPDMVRGVLAICGGLPGDWESGAYQAVSASVLHIATRLDEFYPPDVTEHYPEKLRRRVADLEFHLLEGGNQVPSSGGPIVVEWLQRVLR
jgi:phospholipase/carboxylesterase